MEKAETNITTAQRDAWLALDDTALLAGCSVDAYRASGPGGQKRNKTSSAVRLRHGPSGLIVISEESRSQHANKRSALRRLRMAIAVQLRPTDAGTTDLRSIVHDYVTPDGRLRLSEKNVGFPHVIAAVIDHLSAHGGAVRDVAESIGVSTSQVIRLLASDDASFAQANRIRERHDLPRLRRG